MFNAGDAREGRSIAKVPTEGKYNRGGFFFLYISLEWRAKNKEMLIH